MAYKVQKPCKVCGKMYTPCADCEKDKSTFHWRTVACSVECGMEYFKLVENARNKNTTPVALSQIKSVDIVADCKENKEILNDVKDVEPLNESTSVVETSEQKIEESVKESPTTYRKTSRSKKRNYKNKKESEQID